MGGLVTPGTSVLLQKNRTCSTRKGSKVAATVGRGQQVVSAVKGPRCCLILGPSSCPAPHTWAQLSAGTLGLDLL